MDLHGYPQGEHGRFEQILNQFLLKALHIILDSRVPLNRPASRSGEIKKSDKWFNLVLGDRPAVMESLSFWNRTLMEPMIIDITLVQESPNSSSDHPSNAMLAAEMCLETVVERWIIQYEHQRSMVPQIGDTSYKKVYKKSIILLRSVFSMLRLLPAYKAFRKLCSWKQNCNFDISYKVCSFSSPFSRELENSMKRYSFIPIDAQQGRLSISVLYREDLTDFNLDSCMVSPPEIITDYVGSPLTEPMRAFPSTSCEKSSPTSFPLRGKQTSLPVRRPHSWTSGLHRDISLLQNQQLSGSPPLNRSPYEYSPSPTETYILRNQNPKVSAYQRPVPDDLVSPPFSSSPSPSPPTHFSGGNTVKGRLYSETAPMSIPHPIMGRSPRYLTPNFSDPNRNSLPPLSPRNTRYDPPSHESPSGIRSMRRQDSLRAGESNSGPINVGQKASREDSGRFSGLLSSSSSPRVGFSRSSSRLSFQDDIGDVDFSCPFIVDDVDPPDSQTSMNLDRKNSSDISSQASSTRKSQDTGVGALVHMLRTAPPLHQDSSYYASLSSKTEVAGEAGAASEYFKPRKTSDALEELKAYKEMKDLLLSKSAAAGMTGKAKTET
ncbi:autophagy-related protein 13a [Andrographis paniculata]|uniref:autophagy-related protein 13a n=1 Tax=Andrographis paniculata TaxID=175694 RepID=UPI0021E8A962|nr:autophagy-related protein 13a [Andrographis paniculata]